MKIILKEDVSNLGFIGDTVTVADGYARNYLFPKNLAAIANPRNIKVFEHEKRIISEKIKKQKTTADDMASRLTALNITLKAKVGEEGKLFGAITNKDIVEYLAASGFVLDKRKVVLESPIKRTGEHSFKVKIHPEVTVSLKVNVEEA
jgi:large subunit ribosomal protein L9